MNVFDYEYLDEEEKKELEKQIQSEKRNSNESITKIKKEAYILLYEKIENYYNKHYYKAFEILNNVEKKNEIIKSVLNKNYYDKEVEIYLKSQYYKINKNFYNEYKNYEIPEEKPKRELNWSYFFQVIGIILLFPLFVIFGAMNEQGKKRK